MKLLVGADKKQYEMYQEADYQSFWAGVEREKLDELEQILIMDLLGLPARRIVDLGCGFGRLAPLYMDRVDEFVMLDSSISLLRQAQAKTGGRGIYIACDVTCLPFTDASFDRAMLVRVFHHLPEENTVLESINRILTGGGRLVFTYCNKSNLERIFEWITGRGRYNPFQMNTTTVWDAFKMHHPRLIQRRLSAAGYVGGRVRGAGVIDKLAGRLNGWGRRIPPGTALAPILGRLALAPWIFCEARKPGPGSQDGLEPIEACLRCLQCKRSLRYRGADYYCAACGRSYPIQDGIANFLPETGPGAGCL